MGGMCGSKFHSLWQAALQERPPDPFGAAGSLVHAIGTCLGVETVEFDRVGQVALFLLDLSSLGFKGMDVNVVMISHPPGCEEEARQFADLITDYKHAVKSVGFCFHLVLQWDPPAPNPYISSYVDLIYLCGQDLERLAHSEVPASVLFATIRRQAPLQRLCPFNTTREARGGMFRGRKRELDRLMHDRGTHYVVTGARRIGKTSLLRRAADALRTSREMADRVFYFDCSVWGDFYDCARRLTHTLDARRELRIEESHRNLSYLLERLSYKGKRPLLLFLDECDRLVDYESQTQWPFLRALHEAASYNHVRLAFAGFRSVAALAQGSERLSACGSPFDRSLERLELSPLTPSETEGLLCDPLRSVDILLRDREAMAHRVQRSSAGHPFLVQFYGERLFQRAVERDPQEVVLEDVEAIESGFELSDFLLKHFLNNTMERGEPQIEEQICTLLLAHADAPHGWTEQDFWEACRRYIPGLSLNVVHRSLANLFHARVLHYESGRYTFTFPLMCRALRQSYPNMEALIAGLRPFLRTAAGENPA